jgi:hypothetical protein
MRKILALFLLLGVSVSTATHTPVIKVRKIKIECVSPENGLNQNRTATPGVIRYGENGDSLYQYQMCRSV